MRLVLVALNIFENVDKPNPPEEELRVQRQATRVYIVVLLIILINILLFTLITYQSNTIIVNKPTLSVYRSLPQSAVCPCTNLSIPYYNFIDFNPLCHEVCRSNFTGEHNLWISILQASNEYVFNSGGNMRTFQGMGVYHFQALQIMCELVTEAINNELALFLNSTFISVETIQFDLFGKQINATLSNLLSNKIPSNFLHTLQLIRSMYFGNGLVSAIGTNWYPVVLNNTGSGNVYMQTQEYNQSSCNCATSPTCMEPMTLNLYSGSNWIVPGIMLSCLPLEAMLQSTLECLYNGSCLKIITDTICTAPVPPLIDSRTRFKPINTTTVESIVAELFIEDWGVQISYENYFNSCQPKTCSYSFSKRFNILYSISVLLTIYTGLSLILKFIIPVGFKLGHKYFLRRRRQVRPMNIS